MRKSGTSIRLTERAKVICELAVNAGYFQDRTDVIIQGLELINRRYGLIKDEEPIGTIPLNKEATTPCEQ
jgi:hypothetical protein